jgi:hypothetical protein
LHLFHNQSWRQNLAGELVLLRGIIADWAPEKSPRIIRCRFFKQKLSSINLPNPIVVIALWVKRNQKLGTVASFLSGVKNCAIISA